MQALAKLSVQQKIWAAAAAVTFIAAFLPWVSILGISASGVNGDGQITLILAVVALAALAAATGVLPVRLPVRLVAVLSLVCGAIVLLVALVDMNNFAAAGLWLTMLAGFAWVAASAWELKVVFGRAGKTVSEEPPAATG